MSFSDLFHFSCRGAAARAVKIFIRHFHCLAAVAACSLSLYSQAPEVNTPALPFDQSISDGIDNIDLSSGLNLLSVDIPLINYPQVGGKLQLGFSLYYVEPTTASNLKPHGNGGWFIVENGNALTDDTFGGPLNISAPSPTYENIGLRVVRPAKVADFMAYDGSIYQSVNASGVSFSPSVNVLSGYYGLVPGTVLLPDGTDVVMNSTCTVYDWNEADISCEAPLRKDPSGNSITFTTTGSSPGWTDTAGRHIPLPVSVSVAACPSGLAPNVYALQWTFPGEGTASYPVLICFSYVNTNAISVYSGAQSQIQSISLPDGSSWQFSYSSLPAIVNNHGYTCPPLLSGITYPSGATVVYNYAQPCVAYIYGSYGKCHSRCAVGHKDSRRKGWHGIS